jgi:indole-3-glycerol phosphate synthase
MAGSFLKKIAKEKHTEVAKARKRRPQEVLLQEMLALPPARTFRENLFRPGRRSLIAEIKRRVPDSRSWKPRLPLERQIAAYELGGARAISVVTDEKHFGGKLSLIAEVKQLTGLPILRKDFIVDPYQVYESRAARADALLLIAPLLPERALSRMINLTSSLGMVPVVEVHTTLDLKRATRGGADVVLINNRDLITLKVNTQTVTRLAKLVPRDVMVIAASGYGEPEDLAAVGSERVRSFLIGRALLEAKAPDQLLRAMQEACERS